MMESKFCMTLPYEVLSYKTDGIFQNLLSYNLSNRGHWKSLQISTLFSHEEISWTVGMAIIFFQAN